MIRAVDDRIALIVPSARRKQSASSCQVGIIGYAPQDHQLDIDPVIDLVQSLFDEVGSALRFQKVDRFDALQGPARLA